MRRGVTVWFTGLPGAGKTTVARRVHEVLTAKGIPAEHLDGDVVRQSLTRDLGFSREDREENVARIAFVARLLTRNGVVVLASFVSPYEAMRERARREIGDFLLVWVKASFETLVARDVNALTRKALAGARRQVTGVDDPFEEPAQPDLVLETDRQGVETCAESVLALLTGRGYLEGGADLRSAPAGRAAFSAAVPPHGGTLVDRRLRADAAMRMLDRAVTYPRLVLDGQALSDLTLIGDGAYSPLTGFLGRQAYESVLETMRLPDGTVWPLPITLAVGDEARRAAREGRDVLLCDRRGRPRGLLEVREVFAYDKEREARLVFGTLDPAHPGVARLYRQPPYLVAGPVWVLPDPDPHPFADAALTPAECRSAVAARGWRRVAAFQTRNPIHRAHEYIQKCALEIVDGLLLHPLIGETKGDDVPPEVRMATYRAVLHGYYPPERVLLGVFPAAMRYAGPREALFHALCRKNYGCTHFIVGRDHAGVGRFYDPYAAHRIFERFSSEELGLTPLFFEDAFYCRICGGMATRKTCPHGEEARVVLSGTKVRGLIRERSAPPPECTRREVAAILLEHWRPLAAT